MKNSPRQLKWWPLPKGSPEEEAGRAFYERVGGKTEENVSKFLSSMIREDSVRVVVNQLGYSVDELDQISTAVENTQQNYRKQLASVLRRIYGFQN